jgi:hypothetical protein
MTYDELRAVLGAHDDVEHGDGATDEEVRQTVSRLGDLPKDYREFLKDFGWIAVGPFEIFGLGHDVPDYLNVLTVTLSERIDAGLSDHLIPVMNDGGGNLLCLDISARDAQDQVPLVYWDHETPTSGDVTRVANSFSDWLIALIQV